MVVTGGRGWTSSTPGHLHTALRVCRAHGDVTHGGLGEFVSCPYSFPQHCMPYRLSVGAGLFTNLFWLVIKTHERENTTISTFHAVSKGGTGHFTDFPNFCYRGCFFVSCDSNLTEMSAAARQEGLFTCTIAKRPGINTRMC